MPIKHLFFDLDHTLWDFKKNSQETLFSIYNYYELSTYTHFSFELFYTRYIEINEGLWALYRQNEVSKEELRSVRFEKTLLSFGVANVELARKIGQAYISECPSKGYLFDSCHEVLQELSSRYKLHIITNGFLETQKVKMQSCDLNKYFDVFVTSELANTRKPNPEIFEYALSRANASPAESIMIGDDIEVDCLPAEKVGMQSVWFNPQKTFSNKKVSYKIAHLKELLDLF